jgi:hypothetical protein
LVKNYALVPFSSKIPYFNNKMCDKHERDIYGAYENCKYIFE